MLHPYSSLNTEVSLSSVTSVSKSRRMRRAGHVTRMGEKWRGYGVLVGNPEGKRPLGRPERRRENTVGMNFGPIRRGGMTWIDLAQDREK
jgi:hypothetical protein